MGERGGAWFIRDRVRRPAAGRRVGRRQMGGVQKHAAKESGFFLVSSLEKVFPTKRPEAIGVGTLSAWRGTRAAVQLVYRDAGGRGGGGLVQSFTVSVEGAPCIPELFSVELIPSDFPCYEDAVDDTNYLTHDPGLFPDLLRPLPTPRIRPVPRQYRSVWISFPVPEDAAPGTYEVTVNVSPDREIVMGSGWTFTDPAMEGEGARLTFTLRVGKARLEPQRLLHTEWFHADCLASYYGVEPLSEDHWRILERFIRQAGRRHGINLLLTPVFTPPLDTEIGGERPTVQLVGVHLTGGVYSFDFTNLARWVSICRSSGIADLEIAHLFTQWGAKATPKIIADVDGVQKRLFGWDVPASSPAYRRFLEAFLPALIAELGRLGYSKDHLYFHISDEPGEDSLEAYLTAKNQAADLLQGCQVIDALSGFEFFRRGIVEQPVVSSDHIQPFHDAGVDPLWVYHCCAQGRLVPNRFFAMPSARNRIMGVLLYLYHLKGLLQWGYNFYYMQFSRSLADPFAMTHCDYAFPSGDAYLVYPGPGGEPLSSLRAEVQSEGLTDLRALNTLESLIGREAVHRLVLNLARMDTMTFTQYPTSASFLLSLREAVFDAIEQAL